jgi:hypothetical protein
MDLQTWDAMYWTGLISFKIGTEVGCMLMRQCTFGFHKMRGISWLVEVLLGSPENCAKPSQLLFPCGVATQRRPWPPHSSGFYITHNDAQSFVELLWTSDQLVAGISTWKHATLTEEKHPCLRRDLNTQSQQARGHRPTFLTARPLGPAPLSQLVMINKKDLGP